jgi:hypothetical protein
MPFVITYDSLLTTVADYLERDDIVTRIPTFIMLAERKTSRILKAQLAQIAVTNALTINNPVVVKPQRWVETISFTIETSDGIVVLKERSRETIQTMYPVLTDYAAPKYYAEWQENYYYIGPTPDAAYDFELMMYQQPPNLDVTQQTNYLTENAPDLLLYSTLLEAEGYLKNDERLPVWKAARDEILQQYGVLDQRRQADRQQNVKKGA